MLKVLMPSAHPPKRVGACELHGLQAHVPLHDMCVPLRTPNVLTLPVGDAVALPFYGPMPLATIY